jgi:glycerol-3-phosphate acyltransferase PlsY
MYLNFMILLAYVSGSIPYGLLLTKIITGVDIRNRGSGNIGATNVLRSGYACLAVFTFLLDAVKGTLAILAYRALTPESHPENELIIAAAAILGHLYPIFLHFKGGKGVATTAGCLFILAPHVGMIALIIWITTIFLTRKSSLAALIATILLPLYAYFFSGFSLMVWSLVISGLIIYKHKDNINRLYQGTEPKIDFISQKRSR